MIWHLVNWHNTNWHILATTYKKTDYHNISISSHSLIDLPLKDTANQLLQMRYTKKLNYIYDLLL